MVETEEKKYIPNKGVFVGRNLRKRVIVNFMCQVDWITRRPDICLNIISECR